MESVKLSRLRKEDIKRSKKADGKTLVMLNDGNWYILEVDIVQMDVDGGPIMAYINSIMEDE